MEREANGEVVIFEDVIVAGQETARKLVEGRLMVAVVGSDRSVEALEPSRLRVSIGLVVGESKMADFFKGFAGMCD